MTEMPLLEELTPAARLAAAYAARAEKARWIIVLLFDQRLAKIVRMAREPLLAQLKLAWWRERLSDDPALWPRGEPLLAMVRETGAHPDRMRHLVDGWEALLGEAPLPREDLLAAAQGRAEGLLGAVGDGAPDAARAMALRWALADCAAQVSHPQERAALLSAYSEAPAGGRLPRACRPLVVLHGLAWRDMQRLDSPRPAGLGGLLLAMRLGLFGR